MKKLIIKSTLYCFLILITLEIIVRGFHLSKDSPSRFVDEKRVEKWLPNQSGFSVTGIRRQNFSEFHINNSGYNSYREFAPTKDKIEIALVGDSFIQGFHQDYYNSIGKKIEKNIDNVEVYEYGYAGYDFADQLHLIKAYKNIFSLIDHVILYIDFETDLNRGEYQVATERMSLESPLYKKMKEVKLLVYVQNNGVLEPVMKMKNKLLSTFKNKDVNNIAFNTNADDLELDNMTVKHLSFIDNFESLISKYGYDKKKSALLLDKKNTPEIFVEYLDNKGYNYIDYSKYFMKSEVPTNLIYDQHWNNQGRTLVAKSIVTYFENKAY